MTPDVDDMSTGRLIVELAKDVAALAAIVAIIAITVASVAIGAMRAIYWLNAFAKFLFAGVGDV